MLTTRVGNALGALFFIVAMFVWPTSPSKWETFKRMAVAFVATVAVVAAVGFAVGYLSSLKIAGGVAEMSVSLGLIAAFIMGRNHVHSLKSKAAAKSTSA